VIEHATSNFTVQLELYNTFLQEVIFLQVGLLEPPKNAHLSLPVAPKMQIFDFLNMWKKCSLKIGVIVQYARSYLLVQFEAINRIFHEVIHCTNQSFLRSQYVHIAW